ncbi:hypothetical protein TevJSym_as00700 [endosymbiont of Tevnia jerichonana (vent Tica)]|uniref:Uncharacterized protein n=1 Tax=endosymbiont of Tevnia jerichonana (vent Tica) TaxID=1049564 RepID=G2FH07_9GAMM|nr:hypothetical protein TevJSym_as00700 [endosymbiont of Tevnia jerichonana (vent Tica)]
MLPFYKKGRMLPEFKSISLTNTGVTRIPFENGTLAQPSP